MKQSLVNLISVRQRWTDTNPQEKEYLHTDKPYYALQGADMDGNIGSGNLKINIINQEQ
jgi:hypothetical protein